MKKKMKQYSGIHRYVRIVSVLATLSLMLLITGCGSSEEKVRLNSDEKSEVQSEQGEVNDKSTITESTKAATPDVKTADLPMTEQGTNVDVEADALSVDQNDADNEQIIVVKNYDDAYKAYAEVVKNKRKVWIGTNV